MEIGALKTRPALKQWVIEYWEAFQLLSGSRIIHQGGIGPIPLTEIASYMDTIYLRDVDDRLLMIRMIQSLDKVYMEHVNSKTKKRMKDAKATSKPRRKPRTR